MVLKLAEAKVPRPRSRTKGPKYTPVAKRHDRPNGIAWLVRNFPELSDGQIGRLIGTTKPTINSVRDRTHWNMANIKAQDPVALGICSREDLSIEIEKARRGAERNAKRQKEKKNQQNNVIGIAQKNKSKTDEKFLSPSSFHDLKVAENNDLEERD